jgi:rhodanese-related sulfurtransferase
MNPKRHLKNTPLPPSPSSPQLAPLVLPSPRHEERGLRGEEVKRARSRAAWGSFEDKPDYYPDAKKVFIKIVYDDKILGIQAVGEGNVLREVDAFSMQLFKSLPLASRGMTRYSEFAYAPPYAPALDPLYHLGAMIANREEDGIDFLAPSDSFAEYLVVDLRESNERAAAPAQFKVDYSIPFSEFRARATELPKDKPLLLICEKGPRSYEAARYLSHLGYEKVKYLAAGLHFQRAMRA